MAKVRNSSGYPQDSCSFQNCKWTSIDHPAHMQDVYTMSDQEPCHTPTMVFTEGTDSSVPWLGDQQIKFLDGHDSSMSLFLLRH